MDGRSGSIDSDARKQDDGATLGTPRRPVERGEGRALMVIHWTVVDQGLIGKNGRQLEDGEGVKPTFIERMLPEVLIEWRTSKFKFAHQP